MIPDLVIFRIPGADDDDVLLASMSYENGKLAEEFQMFSVTENDWYHDTKFYHVILARSIPGGSEDGHRYALSDDGLADNSVIYTLPHSEIEKIVQGIIKLHHVH